MKERSLNGKWALRGEEKGICAEAQVPGDIHADLFRAGVIDDPYFGLNHRSLRWVLGEDFVYETTFRAGQEERFRRERLPVLLRDRYIRLRRAERRSSRRNKEHVPALRFRRDKAPARRKRAARVYALYGAHRAVLRLRQLFCHLQRAAHLHAQSAVPLRLGLGARSARVRDLERRHAALWQRAPHGAPALVCL